MKTKRFIKILSLTLILIAVWQSAVFAAGGIRYTVKSGDSMWKIAVQYEIGLSEIIEANPQIANPDLIYPGQILIIPQIEASVLSFEEEVVRLTNEKRAAYGLPALTINWELSRVARYKSQDMHDIGYFSHTSPTYGSPFEMMKDFGISYRAAGENIARGQTTPEMVVNAWWNSSGHRQNMLNASYTQIGVGYVADGHYWTQMFIG
ncbi:MAG: transporter [Clostridiales bacterium]|nr:MAG: transporter [Clostridiales bacterium]